MWSPGAARALTTANTSLAQTKPSPKPRTPWTVQVVQGAQSALPKIQKAVAGPSTNRYQSRKHV
ncbi:hypothetical protein Ptr86124_003515 [Pyrenophora tritici-repentis]|uniref:Uncharacterized protein n=1 Tax=Pyrenophora tritici-repentis TaxID=45151 RepID=A0A922NPJ8_9PLEO|nr:hypothetical protein Ptr86124_003515 [Pyrenophora tritici-repentis]